MIVNKIDKTGILLGFVGKGEKYLDYSVQDAYDYDRLVWGLVPGYMEMLNAVVNHIRDIDGGMSILDLGSGTGTLAKMLLESCPECRLRLVDFSPSMCEVAAEKVKAHSSRVEIECDDMREIILQNAQIVVSTLALHECHSDVRMEYLRSILQSLTPGGTLIVGDYYRHSPQKLKQFANDIRKHATGHGIQLTEIEEEIEEHLLDEEMPFLGEDFEVTRSVLGVAPTILSEFGAVTLWSVQRPLR